MADKKPVKKVAKKVVKKKVKVTPLETVVDRRNPNKTIQRNRVVREMGNRREIKSDKPK